VFKFKKIEKKTVCNTDSQVYLHIYKYIYNQLINSTENLHIDFNIEYNQNSYFIKIDKKNKLYINIKRCQAILILKINLLIHVFHVC